MQRTVSKTIQLDQRILPQGRGRLRREDPKSPVQELGHYLVRGTNILFYFFF